jgi:hypothetical protein
MDAIERPGPRPGVRPGPIEGQDTRVRPGEWVACRHPERPVATATRFHSGCRACLIAARAAEAHGVTFTSRGVGMVERMVDLLDRFGPAPRTLDGTQ